MIAAIVKRVLRRIYARLSRGEWQPVVDRFHEDARFVMLGATPLSADIRGIDNIRAWFARVYELFPDFALQPHVIVVSGPPWRTHVATQFTVSGTFPDGSRYENNGMQLLTLRWGKVIEDFLVEDTHRLADALRQLADQGVAAAREEPFGPLPVATSARGG